jgi:uncharacterized membrane protein
LLADEGKNPESLPPELTLEGSDLPIEDISRILSLSDGIFAFAMTLLVLTLVVPNFDTTGLSSQRVNTKLIGALGNDWARFLGYAFAFVMIGLWWGIHTRTFRYIRRYDRPLVRMNLAILMLVAVMPFVLGVWNAFSQVPVAVALFAGIQAAIGLLFLALWSYATDQHRLVDPRLHQDVIEFFRWRSVLSVSIFAVSIGLAFVSVAAAEASWIGIFVAMHFLAKRYKTS